MSDYIVGVSTNNSVPWPPTSVMTWVDDFLPVSDPSLIGQLRWQNISNVAYTSGIASHPGLIVMGTGGGRKFCAWTF